jgi:catechol 2,3-dioxygenase-like lactoylglutathione lyase family enzyme
MRIHSIIETCLYSQDLETAEAFYTSVLGCEVFSKQQGRHVFFKLKSGMLLIFNPAETARSSPIVPPHGAEGSGHVAFAMAADDVGKWREHLRVNGVEIEKEIRWPNGGFSLYFRDPDQNSLELTTFETWGYKE